MATVLYGLYTPGTGELVVSSAGHLPPVIAAPGTRAGLLPVRPDPPIGTADDPARRSATFAVPPGALLCCFTDGLVERRDQPIDQRMDTLAATLGKQVAAGAAGPSAENACVEVMRALVGNTRSRDDIAVITLSRPRA
jgi:serine phosphatase RsbU (regulator of sigma subunit)